MRYLLDTNIVSEAIRKPNGKIARRLHRMNVDRACVNVIVACELRFGLEKHPTPRLRQKIDTFLSRTTILDLPSTVATIYGAMRADLERRGQIIGSNDMLIAAHAIHTRLILVSDNVKEFERIPGLKLENWLRE